MWMMLKGPMFYEGPQVAMILRGPGIPAGQISREPVSNTDISASALDWAGVSPELALMAKA